jgi:hypothetical protein
LVFIELRNRLKQKFGLTDGKVKELVNGANKVVVCEDEVDPARRERFI